MNVAANDGELDEASLVGLYMELTGASQASARSVYMFVNGEKDEEEHKSNGLVKWRAEENETQPFVAKHGYSGIKHVRFGSIAEQVVHHLPGARRSRIRT